MAVALDLTTPAATVVDTGSRSFPHPASGVNRCVFAGVSIEGTPDFNASCTYVGSGTTQLTTPLAVCENQQRGPINLGRDQRREIEGDRHGY